MVPANYLEVYHQHTPKGDATDLADTNDVYAHPKPSSKPALTSVKSVSPPAINYTSPTHQHQQRQQQQHTNIPLYEDEKYADYDFPKPSSTSPSGGNCESDIYDLPPPEVDEPDYCLPPIDYHVDPHDIYDRPPSNKSSHSTLSASNRISATSVGSTSQIYEIPPPSPPLLYNTPPLLQREEFTGRTSRRGSADGGMDLSKMYENEADDFLKRSKSDIEKEFENLWQCVYGDRAYWGSEIKARRRETVERTISAAKTFDSSLNKLVCFSKGVIVALENSSTKDLNFKKKCVAANTVLINKRQEVLTKIEQLLEADDANVTAVVKTLLEVSRNSPQAAQALLILVQANKAILFKSSGVTEKHLPILTKTEVKNRPLPEIPQVSRYGKVFSGTDFDDDADYDIAENPNKVQSGEDLCKKRRPQDDLPPLPFATLRKPSGKKSKPRVNASEMDYDDIDVDESRINNSRNEQLRIGVNNLMHARNHLLRQSSGSNSSDGGTSSPNRSRSPVHTNPYGHSNYERTGTPSHQPIGQEDRELLIRYSQQMELLVPGLKEAIEIFLLSIKGNDIPRVFVTKSKLAVVAAYKLVYIADALYQKVYHNDTKQLLVSISNQLTDTIKELVSSTKTAALQYPNVGSMDSMLTSLRKLFPSALDLVNSVKTLPS